MAVKGPTSDHGEILSWAQSNAAVPVEVLPAIVDSVPPLLQLMRKERITQRSKIRIISWEDFFAKFAGLWDAWKDAQGHWLQSFAIVTTEANELMVSLHPRMPVILHSRDYERWLDKEETERLPLDLLRPYESEEMEVYEANPKVGNVRNNGPEMMRAAAVAAESGELPL